MLISCASCPVRERQCDTCVVSTFLGMPEQVLDDDLGVQWEAEDHRALDVLCRSGLVSAEDAADARLEVASFTGLRAAV